MSEIRERRVDLRDEVRQAQKERARGEEEILDLFKAVGKDRSRAVELNHIDIKDLDANMQRALQHLIADQLKGQLPTQLATALEHGAVGTDLLNLLKQRLANSADPNARSARAADADAARHLATDLNVPQQALRWTQFVQRAQHVPGSHMQDRAGAASPKGEISTLLELLGEKKALHGASLRAPHLVERALADLSPRQRAALMRSVFGEKMARLLSEIGVNDPLHFVRMGALPAGRGELANVLGLSRGQLLVLLMRAELLKIGPGNNGELGIRPDLLLALQHAGIAMLGTMAAVRSLPREEINYIYQLLREGAAGFTKGDGKSRPVVKRDLLHWARMAARKRSDILLADGEQNGGKYTTADAQELIQAWYLENLFWEEIAQARRQRYEREQEAKDEQEKRDRRQREKEQDEQGSQKDEESALIESLPELEYDKGRSDQLMCFWITDYNAGPRDMFGPKRMYVCVDPETGAIIPQQIELLASK